MMKQRGQVPVAHYLTHLHRQKSSHLQSNKITVTRQRSHRWTDEELNLLAFGRASHWPYALIQKTYFPTYTVKSISGRYERMPAKERTRRSSIAATSSIATRQSPRGRKPVHPAPIQEPRRSAHSLAEAEDDTDISTGHEEDSTPSRSIDRTTNRYNLRSNRPKTFRTGNQRYLVNRIHFPHFFQSYKKHLKLRGLPDRDYTPPSHSPTPGPSDRSLSVISGPPSAVSSLELFGLEARSISPSDGASPVAPTITGAMTDIAKFEQFGLNTFYNVIPTLDNAGDWFQWNQKVNEFIRISAVADDGATPPAEEEEARRWTHRQKFYSAMIAAKLTHNAAQRIKASEISQVETLIKAVKNNFKPEGTGTYVNLQRQYMSLTREKCGSAQALGAEIRKIHAEKLLLDPDCVTSEIERTFFFMHALGPEYESFRDHIFRQMDLVNERDANGAVTRAAPSFDYIENKAIEEEHRKGQLGRQPTEARALPALALVRGPGEKRVIPSSDLNTCRIEIDNVPYCSFCRKPYHRDSGCFSKNPGLKDQKRDGKKPRPRLGSSSTGASKSLKRQSTTDDEDDDVGGPKDSKKPTFMVMRATEEDVNSERTSKGTLPYLATPSQ
ncbi:hypothetical protein EMCG_08482 [[Emmonsia] crescens]|uniref:Uncharacterized protein n=1 Tax=[Emmonsia] crescens TaxID=73230 RepID=A0A0G2JAH0_9EURO|nr:hypothetical protein EMCG_08482 [Emmonsia crescens UAMH 3008]